MLGSRNRLMTLLGVALGVLAAFLFWLTVRKPVAGPSEAMARAMGFPSRSRYNEVLALSRGGNRLRDLTEAQFALIEDVLKNDGPNVKINAISALGSLRTPQQKRRAVQLMKGHVSEKGVSSIIYFVLQTYARGEGRPVVEELAHDTDPVVQQFANTLLQNVPAQSARSHNLGQAHSQGG